MQRQTATVTGVGSTAPLITENYISPFNVGFGVVVTGTVTYSVQHSFDDPSALTTWFNHPTVNGMTANQDGNYAFPVTALRFTMTAGTGTIVGIIVQAGHVA